jgi:hypothetical protein
MTNDIVKHDGRAAQVIPIRGVGDLLDLGSILAASNFFKNTIDENQAAAKILAGMELGISAVASLRGLYIVEGQITLAYPLIGALIKKSGKYDYRIRENTAESCRVEFFENGESVGFSALTMKQATERGLNKTFKGGTKEPWAKFPENMLLSKCLSNGAKAYTSEIFFGSIYTPDELGAEVDAVTGAVIEVEMSQLPDVQMLVCESEGCGNLIRDYTNSAGKTMSAVAFAAGTREKYQKALCWDCAQAAKKATDEAQAARFEIQGRASAEARENRRKAEERDSAKKAAEAAQSAPERENVQEATNTKPITKEAAKNALEDARKRYEEASVIAKQLAIPGAYNDNYRKWSPVRLDEAVATLRERIQEDISSAALESDAFLADVEGDGLPQENEPLAVWMDFAADWELIEIIKADNRQEDELELVEKSRTVGP